MKKAFLSFALFLFLVPAVPAQAQEKSFTDGGLYISGHGLVQLLNGTNETASGNDHHEFDPGYGFTAAIGYVWAFPESPADFRLEVEGSYRQTPYKSIRFANGTYVEVEGDLQFLSGMANLIVDFHIGERISPHVGVGLGRSEIRWRDIVINGTPFADTEEDVTMTQIIAGLGYRLSPGLIIDTEYRLFNPNDANFNGLMGNEFTIGFRMVL